MRHCFSDDLIKTPCSGEREGGRCLLSSNLFRKYRLCIQSRIFEHELAKGTGLVFAWASTGQT